MVAPNHIHRNPLLASLNSHKCCSKLTLVNSPVTSEFCLWVIEITSQGAALKVYNIFSERLVGITSFALLPSIGRESVL